MQYCTIADIAALATEFRRPLQGDNPSIPFEDQQRILDRASGVARGLLHPHYDYRIIDALSPDFPPSLVALTAYIGARIVVESYQASIAPPQQETLLARWEQSQQIYLDEIANAALLDVDGEPVRRATSAVLLRLPAERRLEEVSRDRLY